MRGTITRYKRDGIVKSWGYYFRRKDTAGKWEQLTKRGFETKREAEQALRAALEETGKEHAELPPPGPVLVPATPTFSELLTQFLSNAAMDCTVRTVEAYEEQSRYPRREFGEVPVDQITTEQLQELFDKLRLMGGEKKRPLSPKTLKHIRFIVKSVFDVAVEQKHIPSSPLTKKVRTPKLRKKKFKMPEKERLNEALHKVRRHRLYPLLEVTSATGGRLSEVLALLWTDFHPENGLLDISKALTETKKYGVLVKGTKSDEPRVVSLGPSVIEALEEQRRRQDHEKSIMGAAYDDQGYIFCPPQGGRYRPLVADIAEEARQVFQLNN